MELRRITHRITTSKHTNLQKHLALKEHFEHVQTIKNYFSHEISKTIKMYGLDKTKNIVVGKEFIASLNKHSLKLNNQLNDTLQPNELLTIWEEQKLLSSIMDFYLNRYSKYLSNKSFSLNNGLTQTYYKKTIKNKKNEIIHEKGSLKTSEFTFKKSSFNSLLNYFKYANLNEDLKIIFNEKDSLKNKEQKQILQTQLNTLQSKPVHYRHFLNILSLIHFKLNKLKPIEFTSGSYIKTAVFNKNSLKPTYHSYVFQDNTNTKFQWFYHFKTPNFEIDIPLSYHKKYHNSMVQYDLKKEHYVSYNLRGDINIGLLTTMENPLFKAQEKVVAMDLNVRDNFCIITDGLKHWNFDYNRKTITKLFETLKTIDNRTKTENGKTKVLNEEETLLLKTLVNQNIGMIKNLIAKILRRLNKNGVSDIVMEDLTLFDIKASYIKNKELNQKYTRLVRMLRLSQVKYWFQRNAENYGIKVHFIQAAYSSQECSRCHTIDKNNRNGDTYQCSNCGFTTHSDYNASHTLLSRFSTNVLLEKLHNVDEYNRYVSKKIKYSKVKDIVVQHYDNS